MQSYSSTGVITSDMSIPNVGREEAHYSFSIRLARPQLYRIEWEQSEPNMVAKGVVWSAGDGNFVTVPGQASPLRPKDLSTALSMATGVSGGAAATLPSLFFGLGYDKVKGLRGATFGPVGNIEGDPCYVIKENSGPVGVTMWISKKSKLVRQIRNDFNGPMNFPKMTDEGLKKVLQSMGQEPTAAAIERMKAQMDNARTMMSSGVTGFSIEVQRQIVVNATFRKADFIPQNAPASK